MTRHPIGRRSPQQRRHARAGLLFIAPALLAIGLFVLLPLVGAIALSFTDWALVGTPTPNGLSNYRSLAADPQFKASLVVTAKVAVGLAIPAALFSFALAVVMNSGVRRSSAYQTILFLPAVLPSVVTTIVWGAMYQGDGVINTIIGAEVPWLTNSRLALPAIIFLMIWTNLGYYTIITLAGVRDVPYDVLEAASVDGAGAWRRMWHITLPLVRPVLLFVVVVATTDALTLFVQPYLLTQGGPGDSTRTLSELIYETAFSFGNVGKASAMAVVLLVITLLVALVQFRLLRSRED